MDTTGSMVGTINAMKATAIAFEAGLKTSGIDYKLGVTDCRDYPISCGGSWCGDSGDWAYNVYGLAPDDATWEGWINGLTAGGGADGQEAYLAALTHTATDTDWRGDAQKVAILMCDSDPHPDGHCCNAEGETMASTIAALKSEGVKVYIVHACCDRPWADSITGATGGKVYVGSGSDISGILADITEDLKCTITLESSAECGGVDEIMLCTQILGKDGIPVPYSEGDTEAWATFACAPDVKVPLTYDAATESYCAKVAIPECAEGIVDVTFHGRACTAENSETIAVDTDACRNQPPDCSNAKPSVDTLWPPNHQFVDVNILGVTDPDGDPIKINIDKIWQDEPVDTNGDGSFTPDGQGVGTPTAQVRAERSGTPKVPGNGREYHISFTASDGRGGECEGEVLVGVPHDQNKPVVDDGALYDSTVA
jgi:hypothetical protein